MFASIGYYNGYRAVAVEAVNIDRFPKLPLKSTKTILTLSTGTLKI